MEVKKYITLEHVVDGRVYQFLCLETACLGEVYDALAAFQKFVVEKIQQTQPQPVKEKSVEPEESKECEETCPQE